MVTLCSNMYCNTMVTCVVTLEQGESGRIHSFNPARVVYKSAGAGVIDRGIIGDYTGLPHRIKGINSWAEGQVDLCICPHSILSSASIAKT